MCEANEGLNYSTALVVAKGEKDQKMGIAVPRWTVSAVSTFGEAGVMRCGKNGKMGYCGLTMVVMGSAEN
jgi:hypothetical protein